MLRQIAGYAVVLLFVVALFLFFTAIANESSFNFRVRNLTVRQWKRHGRDPREIHINPEFLKTEHRMAFGEGYKTEGDKQTETIGKQSAALFLVAIGIGLTGGVILLILTMTS